MNLCDEGGLASSLPTDMRKCKKPQARVEDGGFAGVIMSALKKEFLGKKLVQRPANHSSLIAAVFSPNSS